MNSKIMNVTLLAKEKMENNEEKELQEMDQADELTEEVENFTSELDKSCWSIVTYNSVAVSHLTYQEAVKWADDLKKQGVSGLCIITDEAAKRV